MPVTKSVRGVTGLEVHGQHCIARSVTNDDFPSSQNLGTRLLRSVQRGLQSYLQPSAGSTAAT
ncbi:hypothetical protein D3C87_677260 [compost metagenome]